MLVWMVCPDGGPQLDTPSTPTFIWLQFSLANAAIHLPAWSALPRSALCYNHNRCVYTAHRLCRRHDLVAAGTSSLRPYSGKKLRLGREVARRLYNRLEVETS